MKNSPLDVTASTLSVMARGYYFWFILYFVLGAICIALPLAITADIWPDCAKKIAAAAAFASAIFTFLRPHEFATAYDAAATSVWKAKVRARLGQLTEAEAAAILQDAIDKTTFKYGNLRKPDPK